MKPDHYTKAVLTAIAIFLGVIAFDFRPFNPAQAYGGSEHISCFGRIHDNENLCWFFKGDTAKAFIPSVGGLKGSRVMLNWKTGEVIQ